MGNKIKHNFITLFNSNKHLYLYEKSIFFILLNFKIFQLCKYFQEYVITTEQKPNLYYLYTQKLSMRQTLRTCLF